MTTSVFQSVPYVLSGHGALDRLKECLPTEASRVLIITGRGAMRRHGHLARVKSLLEKEGLTVASFEGALPEPPIGTVDEAIAAARALRADCIIGLGGGSALDVAKSAAVLINEEEGTLHFFDGAPIAGTGIPHILIPTTFGTGTEVTPNAVLLDPKRQLKKSIRHDTLRPLVALVDPALGMSAPHSVKTESGMDALTQAIEGYTSRFSSPITDALSLAAVKLLLAGLVPFVEDPSDKKAAEFCALGSLMAAQAFSNCRLGLIHGVVHPLGARLHLPHGRLCGTFLPHALRYNRCTIEAKYDQLSLLAGRDIAEHCAGLLDRFSIPSHLSEPELDREFIAAVVADSMPSGSLAANPRTVTEEDLAAMVRAVGQVGETA